MSTLQKIVDHTRDLLRIDEIPDYPNALNGLQLENSGEIGKIAAAVDACLPVIEQAAEIGAQLLIVHHGMFWSGAQPIKNACYRKLKLAIDRDLAIYSAHIPLDEHPELGNNAVLCRELGLSGGEPFLPWKGTTLGLKFETNLDRTELLAKTRQAIGGGEVHCCPGGPQTVRSVGVCTGGAGAEVFAAAAQGVDTFITGEGQHWTYTAAEELGINLIYAGHYATETFGVKALAGHLAEKFGLSWEFIDHPTGL